MARRGPPRLVSNLFSFDLLDNRVRQDIDCTGSAVSTSGDAAASLITSFAFGFNQNSVKTTKPLGNTVEQDFDERNLKIAIGVGGPSGSVTIMAYDGNMNLTDDIEGVAYRADKNGKVTIRDG